MIDPQSIATQLFGTIDWVDSDTGYMPCPGQNYHTGKNAKRDCKIIVSGAPTIHCFHSSCKGVLDEENRKLRKAIAGEKFEKRVLTEAEKQAFREKQHEKRIQEKLNEFSSVRKEVIFERFEWSPADLWEDSPVRLSGDVEHDSALFLKSLFDQEEIVWIGDVTDSGKPENKLNFRTVKDWISLNQFRNFTCPTLFAPESFSRSNSNVVKRKFLVIESDVLTQEQICAVFKLCSRFMDLRAVVYTGGKSLHGWFDYPQAETVKVLREILPNLGCDEALFKAAQPVRLPGVQRGEKIQSLLYLKS
jgi:hypothetical protein